jgi:hypothetical protein
MPGLSKDKGRISIVTWVLSITKEHLGNAKYHT